MTVEEVKERVRLQAGLDLLLTNDHQITLKQALVPPQKITLIARTVRNGKLKDRNLDAWLVGIEDNRGGYRIVMREDGIQFGLASKGSTSAISFLPGGTATWFRHSWRCNENKARILP